MSLTGLAVVRTPGSWRLVLVDELEAMGLAPRRHVVLAAVVALVAAVLILGTALVALDLGGSLLIETTGLSERIREGDTSGAE